MSPAGPGGAPTLGSLTAGQLRRLGAVAGLTAADAETYAGVLTDSLGPVAERPLSLPPPNRTFLSDDHTPVEFSLSFQPDAAPALRVLLEPGCGADSLAREGRAGLEAVRAMARRWNFSTAALDGLRDLFLPPSPHGPLALWIALELEPGGVPKVKVYLNPAARGAKRSAATVREALDRLGHRRAFASLPEGSGYPFLALDLGDWEEPRAKVYVRHESLTAGQAGRLSRMAQGPGTAAVEGFFRTVAGLGPDTTGLGRRPGLSCHAFTDTASGRPSGFTLHIPVRDYAPHDGEALARASRVLRHHGMDDSVLVRALDALTERRPEDGVGLIAYLALAHQQGRPPRVTAYLSSEAYAVRPPAVEAVPEPVAVG
ncbi:MULTISPECIES: tryptophan dimethylallyltransferase family protein [unclassified Streptomyces]|uniref:tryptophan dimethylallyltransferase family protein n=1 Tax=Streptomyces TaxID=1883 RepID=UPI0025B29F77|nr:MULTISPECIES: tryptophan dimethylallyltransferase family protein [unclassified Streptomyces]MDN3244444.1 tryptophan dimethylallyltransferase family protein [Streptomyces sp. ZSW22]MDN3253538.1 tryptophan dimethylallyltransferase family protein [Streptomyces sp. MA25(2023)]